MTPQLSSLALIFFTAFIATTALALPNPTHSLLRRDDPQPLGVEKAWGTEFVDLVFTVYDGIDCDGHSVIYTGQYGFYSAFQMRSYRLSRHLRSNEMLDFYSGLGNNHTVDHSLNGHFSKACLQFDARAGLNATGDDDNESSYMTGNFGDGTSKGCHTLRSNQWCANIYYTS